MINTERLYPKDSVVLHVTEALNGGIHTALVHIIKMHPDCRHVLLIDSHSRDPLSPIEDFEQSGVTVIHWKRGYYNRVKHLRQVESTLCPSYIHLHSSWAGFFGRIFPLSAQIFYSPHAFAFQRRDVSIIARTFFFCIELVLQLNTDINIAFWPIEHQLFHKIAPAKKNRFNPLLILCTLKKCKEPIEFAKIGNLKPRIVCVGRISVQKDPKFFIDTINIIRRSVDIDVTWIGGGAATPSKDFEDAGIEVLEWLQPNSITKVLKNSHLSLITSAWESGPLTVYESLSSGTPVVWRNIGANRFLNWDHGNTPNEVAETVMDFLNLRKLDLLRDQKSSIITQLNLLLQKQG